MDPYEVKAMQLYWVVPPSYWIDKTEGLYFIYECKLRHVCGVRFFPKSPLWPPHWGGASMMYYDKLIRPAGFMITRPEVKLPLAFLERKVLQNQLGITHG